MLPFSELFAAIPYYIYSFYSQIASRHVPIHTHINAAVNVSLYK